MTCCGGGGAQHRIPPCPLPKKSALSLARLAVCLLELGRDDAQCRMRHREREIWCSYVHRSLRLSKYFVCCVPGDGLARLCGMRLRLGAPAAVEVWVRRVCVCVPFLRPAAGLGPCCLLLARCYDGPPLYA